MGGGSGCGSGSGVGSGAGSGWFRNRQDRRRFLWRAFLLGGTGSGSGQAQVPVRFPAQLFEGLALDQFAVGVVRAAVGHKGLIDSALFL